jgi:hypothetical protein
MPGCRNLVAWVVLGALALAASAAQAENKYHPGASDAEIKIGNIMPYSGPASSHAVIGKTVAAYFDKIRSDSALGHRPR